MKGGSVTPIIILFVLAIILALFCGTAALVGFFAIAYGTLSSM